MISIQEQLPYDLVVFKDGKFKRIQVKYDSDLNVVKAKNSKYLWYKKECKTYSCDDFDYYAIYCAAISKIMYPSIKFQGASFRLSTPNSAIPYYKYEDFLEFTDTALKHTNNSVCWNESAKKRKETCLIKAKTLLPSKDELNKAIWSKPATKVAKDYDVSNVTIAKWCKKLGIEKPPVGYWIKKNGRQAES